MKVTNLTIPQGRKRIWREDAFDGGLSRADLVKELLTHGFKTMTDGTTYWYQLERHDRMEVGRGDPYSVWIDLDIHYTVGKDGAPFCTYHLPHSKRDEDGRTSVFTKEDLVEVRFVGKGNTRCYRVEDLWEGVRTQWLRMMNHGDETYKIEEDCVSFFG